MCKNNVFLIEIITEELPVIYLINLVKDFIKYLSINLNKNYFVFTNIKYYWTIRRFSCVINSLSYIKKKKLLNKDLCDIFSDILNNIFKKLLLNRKIMQWSINNYKFIRPVRNIILMINNKIIQINILGLNSTNISLGHKFIGNKKILISDINKYEFFLYKYGKVILDHHIRKKKIKYYLNRLSFKMKVIFIYRKNLLDLIVSLLEWPKFILVKFNKKYLSLPKEIIIFIFKNEYKFFIVLDKKKKLLNFFLIFINVNKSFWIKQGYIRMINSKLKDIFLFFYKDRKYYLIDYLQKLKRIIFFKNLGSLYDKSIRILFLVKKVFLFFNNIKKKKLLRATLLYQCDIATLLVKNYPELKSIVGMNYALLDKESYKICLIIKKSSLRYLLSNKYVNNYSYIIYISDTIDTIVAFSLLKNFLYIKKSNDPYKLRRLSLSLLQVILYKKIYIDLFKLIKYSICLFKFKKIIYYTNNSCFYITKFIFKRAFNLFLNLGYKSLIINFFLSSNNYDITDIRDRLNLVSNLKDFVQFNNLVNVIKRVHNFIKKNSNKKDISLIFKINKLLFKNSEELDLFNYINLLETNILKSKLKHNYVFLLKILFLSFKIIDNFFIHVKINTNDIKIKNNRFLLLKKLNFLFYQFGNFSVFF